MGSVSPATLPALDSSLPWGSDREFRWRYSSTGYEHYDVHLNSTNTWWSATQSVQGIKVDTNDNTWYDDGANDPVTLSLSNGTISVIGGYGGTQTLYTFTKPTTPSWNNPDGPDVTSARTSHSGIIPNASDFTIRNPNPGTLYERTGSGKFKIKFYDQNEPFGGYNITINWTKMDDTSASHTETVSAAAGDYSIEIDTSSYGGVKNNSNITITFNSNTFFNGTSFTAGDVLSTWTYIANGPFTGSFTPNSGQPGTTVTLSIQDSNNYPEQSRVVSYELPNGNKTNVTLNSANSWQFQTTFTASLGTAKIYDTDVNNQNSSNVIATGVYSNTIGNAKRDGYPMIMTNLFNRNRSIYSIGMTHKTASDPFY